VDAHALVFQLFHAIPAMSSPDGRPTNAVFGFARDMIFLRDDQKPAYLLCAFDLPAPTFREKLYPDYKAHRPPPPDDLSSQVPLIKRVLEGMRIPVLGVPGYEADDVMATVAAAASRRGQDVYVCTSDKDCRQLIDGRVRLFNLRKRQPFAADELLADWGITPEQVVDYQTLVGDSVDNVPGVPGVGPKTAAKLLQQFGTLDKLVAGLDEAVKSKAVTPRIATAIRETAAGGKLELSRTLVRLDTAVPMGLDWDTWRLAAAVDAARLRDLFQELGLRSLLNRVKAGSAKPAAVAVGGPDGDLFSGVTSEGDAAEPAVGDYEVGDFAFGANAPAEDWQADYKLVDTDKKLAGFLKTLKKLKRFTLDLETTGLDPLTSEIVGLAFSFLAGEAYYLPVRAPEGESRLDPAATLAALKPVLEDPAVAKVNQNIKFDALALRRHGVRLAGIAGDPMVADYLLRSGERSHNLDELAGRLLNHTNIPITDLIGKKGKNQLTLDQVSTAKVCQYSAEDADVAWRLAERLEPELEAEGLRTLYDELEVPLIDVLADLEYTGVRLDVPFLERLSAEMAQQLQQIEKAIHDLAGHPFNIASPKQLRTVLFDEQRLPVQKRTGLTNEPSTDQETLERLAALGHPLPVKITEHRQVSKLKGTYVDALPALVSPYDGRVHTSFNQTVAATGRFSSSDPNLQNVPARTEQGKQIRQAFLPAEGWALLTADYSQVELRLLAHFSGDEALRAAFAEDRDVHASVAAEIFKVPEGGVTSAQRRVAKTVNFGVIYGISPHGLATRLGMPQAEAAKFIDAYFARYPKVLDYQDRLLADCRKTGYVGTILGRRRRIEGIRPVSSYQHRNQPEREAINMEIQGSAADLMKRAMLAIHRALPAAGLKARMLLTVHDELVFEAPPEELRALAGLVRREMTTAIRLGVPLKVDVAAGPNWLDVSEAAIPA
jgi:DNA polymerase-1